MLSYSKGEDSYMHVLSPVATPIAEEQLLIPLRAEASAEKRRATKPVVDFDPGGMEADLIEIEVEIGPSTVCIYGCLIMNLYHVKVCSCGFIWRLYCWVDYVSIVEKYI